MCYLICNKDCLNRICDILGQCVYGCDDGKYGSRCDQDCLSGCRICYNLLFCLECEDGYFGKLCIKYCLVMNNGKKN